MLPDSILPTPEDDIARVLANFEKRLSHLERLEGSGLGLGARVFNNANISIPNNAATFLTFNSERFDNDNIHDIAVNTDRLTVRTAGIYVISGSVRWAANATGFRLLRIHLQAINQSLASSVHLNAGAVITDQTISTIYELVVGDFVQLRVQQNSGGALNIEVASQYSPEFSMVKVG